MVNLDANQLVLQHQIKIPMNTLPLGHASIDVLDFGTSGWKIPSAALAAGRCERDFKVYVACLPVMRGPNPSFCKRAHPSPFSWLAMELLKQLQRQRAQDEMGAMETTEYARAILHWRIIGAKVLEFIEKFEAGTKYAKQLGSWVDPMLDHRCHTLSRDCHPRCRAMHLHLWRHPCRPPSSRSSTPRRSRRWASFRD